MRLCMATAAPEQTGITKCSWHRKIPCWALLVLPVTPALPDGGALLMLLSSKAEVSKHSPKKNQKCGQIELVA